MDELDCSLGPVLGDALLQVSRLPHDLSVML